MANSRSSNVSPAPVPAPLPPNRGEGYQIRPFYLCVDVSGSMGAIPQEGSPPIIDLINDDLTSVLQVIHDELEISEVIKMAMVTFADTATVVLPLSNPDTVDAIPTLQATGSTSYLQPLRKLREAIAEDFQNRKPNRWFRPVVFFISDGYPNVGTDAEWQAARDDLLDPGWEPHPIFAVFGFGNAKADVMRILASGQKYTGLSCLAPEGQTPRSQLKRIIELVQLSMVSTAKNPEQFGIQFNKDEFILLSRPGDDDLG